MAIFCSPQADNIAAAMPPQSAGEQARRQQDHRWRTGLLLLGLFLATWTPRVLALDAFVTPDERKWLARSANFYQAISHGDLAHTFQREHPGVMVMWAGTLGFVQYFPTYAQQAPGQFAWESEDLEAWLHGHSTLAPLDLLVAGRWWIVLGITLAITAGYFPLRRLLGESIAVLATLFIAWDPFFIALSRQLHPDGLVSSLILLALLLFLAWLYAGQARRYLLASALVMGLAWLTKTPAIFLVPIGAVLVGSEFWRARRRLSVNSSTADPSLPTQLRRLLLAFIGWNMLAVIVFVGLWPAMWVNPLGTLGSMAAEMSDYVEGHVNPNYFLGQPTNDPGLLFYPLAVLFRTTPAVLLGLLASAIIAWRHRSPFDRAAVRRAAAALLCFALLFVVGMSLGAKKFDRYILPTFLALDIVAALGWAGLAQLIHQRISQSHTPPRLRLLSGSVAFGALCLLHGLLGFAHYPYYFTYFNPLAGGSTTAPRVLWVGWGEGLDAAAAWLNQQPDAANQRVVAWYGDGPLSYFLQNQQPILSFWAPEFWVDADYAVFYVNQWQRQIPSQDVVSYFSGQMPAHVVRANGLELARIYAINKNSPPEFTNLATESAADFDGKIRLTAYVMGEHTFLSDDHFLIRLYLKSLAVLDADTMAVVSLIAPDGTELWRSEARPAGQATSSWPLHKILTDEHEIVIPAGTLSGQYQLTLAFYDPAAPQTALPVHSDQPRAANGAHLLTTIEVQAAKRFATTASWGNVRLTGLQYEPNIQPGQTLFVELVTEGQAEQPLKLSARLVDATGQALAQTDKELMPTMRFDLTLPDDAGPGLYTLSAVVYDPETLNPIPDDQGNFSTTLSEVNVEAK